MLSLRLEIVALDPEEPDPVNIEMPVQHEPK